MGRIHLISLFAVCLAISVGISSWLRPEIKQNEPAVDTKLEEQFERLSRRLEGFEDRLKDLAISAKARSVPTAVSAQPPVTTASQPMSSTLETPDAAAAQALEEVDQMMADNPDLRREAREQYRGRIDEIIAHQGVDSERTHVFWETVMTTVDDFVKVDTSVEEASCSDAFCRLVVRHEDRTSQSQFLDQVQGRPGFRDEGIAHVEEDGTTFIYLVRDGDSFPNTIF